MELLYMITNNIYLYSIIIILLIIIAIILTMISSDVKKRKEIKESFKEATDNIVEEKPENEELSVLIDQMKHDMDVKPEEVVLKFEEEQENSAIISYQELIENVKNGKIETTVDEESDVNFVEAITGEQQVEPVLNAVEQTDTVSKEQLKEAINIIEENKKIKENQDSKTKFKNTEFISPVFGKQKSTITYPTVNNKNTSVNITKSFSLEEINDELKKSEAFLTALIEFRNNL